jgi:hypothetical protein
VFYFDQLLGQGLAGIDRTSMLTGIMGVAYAILLIGFLVGLYQAVMRGGDVRELGVSALKYIAVAMVLANWSTAFREVNSSFNQLAQFIDNSSGAGDMFLSWLDQLSQQFRSNGVLELLSLVQNTDAALITVLLIVISYLVYAAMVVVFAFFYTLYGCVLYVTGPLVLSLLPMAGIGQLAKSYVTNLMIWNFWGILYAVFGSLITAIQLNRIADLSSFAGFFTGTIDSFVLGLISIFYALALGMIPFIARRIVAGDVGGTAFALVRAGSSAAAAALAGWAGVSAGLAGSSSGVIPSAGGALSSSSGAAGISPSLPPPEPSLPMTIRAGVDSALNGLPPPEPASVGGEGSPAQVPESQHSSVFHSSVLSRSVAYQVGRMAASAMKGRSSSNHRSSNA